MYICTRPCICIYESFFCVLALPFTGSTPILKYVYVHVRVFVLMSLSSVFLPSPLQGPRLSSNTYTYTSMYLYF